MGEPRTEEQQKEIDSREATGAGSLMAINPAKDPLDANNDSNFFRATTIRRLDMILDNLGGSEKMDRLVEAVEKNTAAVHALADALESRKQAAKQEPKKA